MEEIEENNQFPCVFGRKIQTKKRNENVEFTQIEWIWGAWSALAI